MKYERINVVGTSGSGKSTLAQEMAKRLNLPYIEQDTLFWKSNWTESTDDEYFPKLRDALAPGRWVLDGNYDRTRHIKWKHVQMVVWLDLPLYLVFARVFARAITRSYTGKELWAGNKETFKRAFLSRNSIILWSLTRFARNRRRYRADAENDQYRHIQFVRLHSMTAVNQFLNNLKS